VAAESEAGMEMIGEMMRLSDGSSVFPMADMNRL
jgi:hypothetical protein